MKKDINSRHFRECFINPDSPDLDEECFRIARAGSEYTSLILDARLATRAFEKEGLHKYRRKGKRSTPIISLLPPFSSLTGREGDWKTLSIEKGQWRELANEIRTHHRAVLRNFLSREVPLLSTGSPSYFNNRMTYLDELLADRQYHFSAEHPQGWLGNVSEAIAVWLLSGQGVGQDNSLPNDILLERPSRQVAIEVKTMRLPHEEEWRGAQRMQNVSRYPSKKQFVLRLGQLNTMIDTIEKEDISGFYLIAPYHLRWAGGMTLTRFIEDRLGVPKWGKLSYAGIDKVLRSSIMFGEMWLIPSQELKYLITEHIQGMYPESVFNPHLSYPAGMAPFYLKTQMRHLASMALRLGSFEIPEYIHTATIFGHPCTIRSFGLKLSEQLFLGEIR